MRVSAKSIPKLGRDPLHALKEPEGVFKRHAVREKRQDFRRHCYFECESNVTATYRYSNEQVSLWPFSEEKFITEYQGKPVLGRSLSLQQYVGESRGIYPEFCSGRFTSPYSLQQFADRVCTQFGAGATTVDGCGTQAQCVGSATATSAPPTAANTASLGAIAVVPVVGLAIGVGLAVYAAYKYIHRCGSRRNPRPDFIQPIDLEPRSHRAIAHDYQSTGEAKKEEVPICGNDCGTILPPPGHSLRDLPKPPGPDDPLQLEAMQPGIEHIFEPIYEEII